MPDRVPELLHLVEREQIWLSYRDLKRIGRLGMYLCLPSGHPVIVLERTLVHSSALHASVLAEELGHHFTSGQTSAGTVYFSYSLKVALGRDEARALRWAVDHLMPAPAFCDALRRGYRSVDELAELFGVTVWLVQRRIRIMRLLGEGVPPGGVCRGSRSSRS